MIATILAVGMVLTAALTTYDVVKLDLQILDGIARHEVDDLLAGLLLIFLGVTIDLIARRKRHKAEIEAQKLRTLKATMRTVHDIVNNFLNNLMVFELQAAAITKPGALDPLERIIHETAGKLKALGDLESVREIPLAMGPGIHYKDPTRS
jgi:hypothetical protein